MSSYKLTAEDCFISKSPRLLFCFLLYCYGGKNLYPFPYTVWINSAFSLCRSL